MDCRTFRKNHFALVDDTLPGVLLDSMRAHLATCDSCASVDRQVRRGLVVARNNAPCVELSKGFESRLRRRLAEERLRNVGRMSSPSSIRSTRVMSLGVGLAVVVAGVGVVLGRDRPEVGPDAAFGEVRPMAIVTAATGGVTPAFVSSVSTGMAILPALLLVEEMPGRIPGEDRGLSFAGDSVAVDPIPRR